MTIGVSLSDRIEGNADIPNLGSAGGWLSISVADTGIGISADQHENIFELFTQADGALARAYEGAGLGLALARSLARLHGGTIQLESEPDKGSTFTLILPTTDEPSS